MFEDVLLSFLSGVIQGVTEWLPISSKTMLFFLFHLWGISTQYSYMLSLILNGSTIAAASIYFRKELVRLLGLSRKADSNLSLLMFLVVSTFVTGILGVILHRFLLSFMTELSSSGLLIFIGCMMFVSALVNWLRMKMNPVEKTMNDVNLTDAFITGVAQSFSVLPGISRSGVTILVLVIRRYNVKDSLTISYLMSIPVTLGGSIYAYITYPKVFQMLDVYEALFSVIVATIVSLAMISILLRLSQKLKPHLFLSTLSIITILSGLLFR
ncbi:MAG: undecaprenyl-diphosphate phosphatase [Nitrososphaerota archaeon]